tara:strand:+ start:10899 stop:12191 length:1293 start_codon:yes stop_codon:yes gene_type:complete
MTPSVTVEGSEPLSNGRFRLDDPVEDARRLFDTARNGDGRAQARLALHRTSSASTPLEMKDALHTVAREMGFTGWRSFEQYVAELDAAERRGGDLVDGEQSTVHIRCGDDLREALPRCGLHGRCLTFADPFCVGPVQRPSSDDHFVEERSRFLAEALNLNPNQTLERQRREYRELGEVGGEERVVLWFEHDSYDQLILAYVLDHFGRRWPRVRLELVATDAIPGVRRFVGLGQLAPEVLGWLWERRKPVEETLLVLGRRAWRSISDETPEALDRLTQRNTPALPMLGRALRRHLLELPDEETGLGLSEQLIVQLVAERGPKPAGEIFRDLMLEREPLPYLGDSLFHWMLRPLLGGTSPVLRWHGDDDLPWQDRELAITDHGHAVLSGHQNWLDTHPPRRWVSGVPIDGDRQSWCLNKANGRPQRRPANSL